MPPGGQFAQRDPRPIGSLGASVVQMPPGRRAAMRKALVEICVIGMTQTFDGATGDTGG